MDNINRLTFETVEFQLETLEAPKIKAGGSSSSNVLNRYFESLSRETALLTTRSNALALRADRFENGANEQAGALMGLLTSLSSRVDTASAYSQILVDMFSEDYVDVTTTANVNHVFGQAILPIRSQINLLVQEDVYGQKYVATNVETSVAHSAEVEPDNIPIENYETDVEGIFMLRETQTWLTSASTVSGVNTFFKIKAPLQFRGLQPNTIEIYPFPAFGTELLGVWYQKADDPIAGTWYPLDLSYCGNYRQSTGTVPQFSPIRLFVPETVLINQLVIGIKPHNSRYVGFKQINVFHQEYESSAILAVKDIYSRTVSSPSIRGKDPGDLSQLTVSTSTNVATISMTSDNTFKTPVITGVIMAV